MGERRRKCVCMWAGVRECKGRASTASNEIVWVCPRVDMSPPTHTDTQTPTREHTHRHGTDIGDTCRVAPTQTSSGRPNPAHKSRPRPLSSHRHQTYMPTQEAVPHFANANTGRAVQGGRGNRDHGHGAATKDRPGQGKRGGGRACSAGQTQPTKSPTSAFSSSSTLAPWLPCVLAEIGIIHNAPDAVARLSGESQPRWRSVGVGRLNVGKDHHIRVVQESTFVDIAT